MSPTPPPPLPPTATPLRGHLGTLGQEPQESTRLWLRLSPCLLGTCRAPRPAPHLAVSPRPGDGVTEEWATHQLFKARRASLCPLYPSAPRASRCSHAVFEGSCMPPRHGAGEGFVGVRAPPGLSQRHSRGLWGPCQGSGSVSLGHIPRACPWLSLPPTFPSTRPGYPAL